MRKAVIASALLLLCFTAATAPAANFDCKKAATAVEKMICADAELSKLDEELGTAYKRSIERAESESHRKTLRSWQNAWIKYRDKLCGAHAECLRGHYRYRISIFDRLVEEAKQPPKRDPKAVFMFEKGQGVPVCEEYKRFLDNAVASYRTVNAPLMCQRAIPSDFPAFSQPEWREIDPREHMDLAIAVWDRMMFPWQGEEPPKRYRTPKQIEERRDSIVGQYENNHGKWYLAQADVDNDGRVEGLVKHHSGRCNDAWPDVLRYSVPIMVVSEDGKSVNGPKTRQLLRINPDRPIQSFSIGTTSIDVFAFRDQVHIDRWYNEGEFNGIATNDKTLSVYLNERGKNVLVCQYWFSGKTN